jgi:4'-phosphopantetheinyl transferase
MQSLEIRAAEDGAPEAFWSGQPAEVSISISHSRGRSICAVARDNLSIGCDLEWIEPREENFAEDYFTAEEMAVILGSPLERSIIVNLIWSAKEAALKVVRAGLSRDTRSVVITPDFSAPEGGWNKFSGRCLESSGVFYGWWRTGEGYVYTIASNQPTAFPKELIL